jgi:PEP-CTERM motif
MSIFRIASAVILALCVTSARAGTITYDFVEETVGPPPAIPVAILAFLDPPASPTSGWTTANASNIVEFTITDSALAPVGSYTPQIFTAVVSDTGTTLDEGLILGAAAAISVFAIADSMPGQSALLNNTTGVTIHGDWVLGSPIGSSVPEPSSLAIASTGAIFVVVYAWRRRRRLCAIESAA